MKKLFALLLCLSMLVCVFAGCSGATEEDPGAYITMYMSDKIYNLDPAYAYGNESSLKVISLLYENLFVLDEKGQPQKSLVKDYTIDKEENSMILILREDIKWTDGVVLSAYDVIYAWERILDAEKSFEAAVLLYDIKNARAAKEGDVNSIDDVGVEALQSNELKIYFEENVDYDRFIANLASYALAPVRSDVIQRTVDPYDWAKSPATIVTSGPFRLRKAEYPHMETPAEGGDPQQVGLLVLERSSYYRRNPSKDNIDKSVTPYRIVIDYSYTEEEILQKYESGEIAYIGDLPISVRSQKTIEQWNDIGQIKNSMSTHAYVINFNAPVQKYTEEGFKALSGTGCVYKEDVLLGTDGEKIFDNPTVREALSLALNRDAIAKSVVFAEPATGLVPKGVFETISSKNFFSDKTLKPLSKDPNMARAKELLAMTNISPEDYMFAVSVPAYDEVHVKIAEQAVAAWNELGFHVALNKIEVIKNKDAIVGADAKQGIEGIYDDIFMTSYREGKFYIAAIDYTALSTDAFVTLAPFAKGYTGGASKVQQQDFIVPDHFTGFNGESNGYNAKIDAAYKETNAEKRAALLHEAENILMSEMPVIPVVFNQSISVIKKGLSNVDLTYYHTPVFTKAKLKNHLDFIPPSQTELPKQSETDTAAPAIG